MRLKKRYIPDLVQMAAVCEANYIRLLKLLPNDQKKHTFSVSSGSQAVSVSLTITEEHPYTTMLDVQQQGLHNQWLQPQSMQVRMYHDANMAEVLSYQQHSQIQGSYKYPNQQMHSPDEKLQLNLFLAQWLGHCLEHGIQLKQTCTIVP